MKLKICHCVLLATLILFPVLFNPVFAVTADPNPVEYKQPDGSTITLMLKGDEFIHWATTTDGYTIMTNKSGAYEYAALDAGGKLVFSGVQAHNPTGRSAQETAFLGTIQPGIFFSAQQIKEMKAMKQAGPNRSPSAPTIGGFPTTGTRKLLLILANFNNTTTTYSQSNFNNLMNQVGYNGTGSFRDFYLEVSYGQLTVNTTVTVWVTLPQTHDYYGPDYMWGEFAYQSCVAANNQTSINFAEFDNDGDGTVDGVAIFHQGRGQEESGNINDIWSHSWDLTSAGYSAAQRTFDGVLVDAYTTQPEKTGSAMVTIGVMCHEFGHNLGAPDFYDTDYSTSGSYDGTGEWDVMAGGSWNGASGTKPAHHNAWTKNYFTWTTPTIISTQQNVLLRNAQVYTDAVRYNTTTANEYYLCENRQQTGFDVGIPGHGLIIYHVDGSYITAHMDANDINCTSHQGMYPMAANATTASGIMTSGGSTINTGGCSWPGTSSKTTFTDATTPCSKSWAGANTNKPLINIAENTTSKEITFCFIACSSPNDPGSFNATAMSSSQVDLVWTKNASNDPVLVAFNTTPTFGTPVNGTTYAAGNTISGGGTVLYNGSATTFSHTSLSPNTTYYYKAWSVMTGTTYSSGVTDNATTFCGAVTSFPYNEGFENSGNIPSCWSQEYGTGALDWEYQAGGHNGNPAGAHSGSFNAFFYEGAYGPSNTTKLVTPPLNISSLTNPQLTFWHAQPIWDTDQDELRVYFKTTATGTWVLLATYTSDLPSWTQETLSLPSASSTYYIAFEGKENYGYGVCLDDVNVSATTPPPPTLSVTPSNQNVGSLAGNTSFTVTSNSSWTAVSSDTWCTVTPSGTGNGTIVATYTDNPNTTTRVATITVTVTGVTPQAVTVTQSGVAGTLSLSPSNQNVPSTQGTTTFNVTSNVSWTASSDQTWCTVTASGSGNGTINADYQNNMSTASRIAIITVTGAGLTPQTVTVTQAGAQATLAVSPSNQDVTADAGATSFSVSSNSSWTASSDQTWCLTTPSGTGNGTIDANYQENLTITPRVANITVTVPGIPPKVVTVTQDGAVGTPEKENSGIMLYPNPNDGRFTLVAGKNTGGLLEVTITDLTGRTVKTEQLQDDGRHTFNLSGAPAGCYFVKVKTERETKTIRMILSK
jgi:M6 family metalloprotease-like protein